MRTTPTCVNEIIALARMYHAKRLILFGSFTENPEKARDIDLACDGIEGWKLYEFGAKLEETLNVPVDVIPLSQTDSFHSLH